MWLPGYSWTATSDRNYRYVNLWDIEDIEDCYLTVRNHFVEMGITSKKTSNLKHQAPHNESLRKPGKAWLSLPVIFTKWFLFSLRCTCGVNPFPFAQTLHSSWKKGGYQVSARERPGTHYIRLLSLHVYIFPSSNFLIFDAEIDHHTKNTVVFDVCQRRSGHFSCWIWLWVPDFYSIFPPHFSPFVDYWKVFRINTLRTPSPVVLVQGWWAYEHMIVCSLVWAFVHPTFIYRSVGHYR